MRHNPSSQLVSSPGSWLTTTTVHGLNDVHGTPHMMKHTWEKTRVAIAAVSNSLIVTKQLVAGRCLGLMYGGSPGCSCKTDVHYLAHRVNIFHRQQHRTQS